MIDYVSEAEGLRTKVSGLLRDVISLPSLSTEEAAVARRLSEEASLVGAQDVFIDRAGTFIARFGTGGRTIVFDSHIDTVDVGARSEWSRDPFDPFVERTASGSIIHGRGASDNKAGIASMLYGAAMWQRLHGDSDFTIYVVGSVQEESCDGLALYDVLSEGTVRSPELVVLGEATNCQVYRGNRGRIEAYLRLHGQSCHASAPERGLNPVTELAPLIAEIDRLNRKLTSESFLGKGSVAITKIECETPSLNAVPSTATLFVDRRLSLEETPQSALKELRDIASSLGLSVEIDVLTYEATAYTGHAWTQSKEFNTWMLPENNSYVESAVRNTRNTTRPNTSTSHWVFSTNGVASMGKLGIPTLGYGPGNEVHAHTAHDQCPENDLVDAIAWYASFPATLESE